jgi:hypothetical protein
MDETVKKITKRMSPKKNRKRRKEECSVFLSYRKIIMGKNFHMEGRYHLHLSETAVRILLPRHLVDRPMVSDSCSEHDP